MDTRDRSNMANVVGWIALILSIIALILAWVAFNRTGENLEDRARDGIQQVLPETNQEQQQAQPETEDPQFNNEQEPAQPSDQGDDLEQ